MALVSNGDLLTRRPVVTSEFTADCRRCSGLCCVALPFSGRGFAIDKAAGVPCPNLEVDHRCTIHERLDTTGWRGCTIFDCAGAGQRVTAAFADRGGWRRSPQPVFTAFRAALVLHELLEHLDTAKNLVSDGGDGRLARRVARQLAAVEAAVRHVLGDGDGWGDSDGWGNGDDDDDGQTLAALSAETTRLLTDVATWYRAGADLSALARKLSRRAPGADLTAARLRGADLRFTDLRCACLIAADLRGADLRGAVLLGADLRDARLRDARLDGALFITTRQRRAAVG